jgi:hypothetical protein
MRARSRFQGGGRLLAGIKHTLLGREQEMKNRAVWLSGFVPQLAAVAFDDRFAE